MFNFSNITWINKEDFNAKDTIVDANVNVLPEQLWFCESDCFSTVLNIINGASYPRSISYRLLKNYEEIDYIWTDLEGNIISHDIKYNANKENIGEQIVHFLDITEKMGTGEYIIIPCENKEYANEKERHIKIYTPAQTARTMITFENNSFNDNYLKNFKNLQGTVIKQNENLSILSSVQLGDEFSDNIICSDVQTNLKQLKLPLYIDLSYKLSEAGNIGVIPAENQNDKIPVAIIGYFNEHLLKDKYYTIISLNQVNVLYPDWELAIDPENENLLEVYLFCFPGQKIDDLKPVQKFLYCANLNAKIYIEKS